MYSVYLAMLIFVLFALIIPFAMLLTSVLIRNRKVSNKVKDASFESAEASSGRRISIMNEYLHYFSVFVAFDIIAALVLIWAYSAETLTMAQDIAALMLPVASFAMVVITIAMIKWAR